MKDINSGDALKTLQGTERTARTSVDCAWPAGQPLYFQHTVPRAEWRKAKRRNRGTEESDNRCADGACQMHRGAVIADKDPAPPDQFRRLEH